MAETVKTLYLPSTPLNVLVSCAVALHKQAMSNDEHAQLWLIDQKNSQNNPYFNALQQWQNSPFSAITLFSAEQKGQSKLNHRRKVFAHLVQSIKNFTPTQVAVGSDRRVEFQFVMQFLKQVKQPAKGLYLDDGLYSYAGRTAQVIKDGVNALLKKMVYGLWWQEPKTVGASSWINQAWLFAPNKAVALLQSKELVRLESSWFTDEKVIELSRLVAKQLKFDVAGLVELDVMILIPHPNNIKKMPGYKKRIQHLVRLLKKQEKKVGIKYHPRTEAVDLLELIECGARVIVPSQLAFEFCLPLFSENCQIVGDIGTALLSCKWLRPELKVCAVLDESDGFQEKFIAMSQSMGIRVTHKIEDSVA